MHPFSILIVCKNEADVIGATLQSLQGLSDDIVVFDNGSTDGTQNIVKQNNVNLIEGTWEGYGKTKRKATQLVKNDWVLHLDADEAVGDELRQSLLQWKPDNELMVYELAYRNYFGNKYLKHGEWGKDNHIRLVNRKQVNWNEAPVHEDMVMPPGVVVKRLKGFILHRTAKSAEDYRQKMLHYAQLGAEKYKRQDKKATWVKKFLSPAVSFLGNYIFKLGFLDGSEGYSCAKITAWYTYKKYQILGKLNKED